MAKMRRGQKSISAKARTGSIRSRPGARLNPHTSAKPSGPHPRLTAAARASKARLVARTLLRPSASPSSLHALGNPLSIASPPGFMSYAQARRIFILRRQQHLLWSWAIALAILLVFIISVSELMPTFGLAPALPPRTADLLEGADLIAFLVIGLELYGHYRLTANKMLFLRQNALAILAMLPIGLLARAMLAVQSLGALRGIQAAGKFDELSILLPSLNLRALEVFPGLLSGLTLQLHSIATRLGGVSEFLEMVAESLGRLLP